MYREHYTLIFARPDANKYRGSYVTGMRPLPAIYAVTCENDRWLAVAPDQHGFRARTYERHLIEEDVQCRQGNFRYHQGHLHAGQKRRAMW
jgi:hypothetical protein